MLTPEQKRQRDAIKAHDLDLEIGGPPFYDGGDCDDNPEDLRPSRIREARRLANLQDSDILSRDDAYSLRMAYLTFCEKSEVHKERHLLLEFPKVIGECAGVFVIQTGHDRARLFDMDSLMLFPEGCLQPILARQPYDAFDDEDGNVLALFKDLVKDE